MNSLKIISSVLVATLFSGCASTRPTGSQGPQLVSSGQATESGQYAEVGVEFTSWGDFVALVSPNRWSSPITTGGSLSWLNPVAWGEDSSRTGRILLGEAVLVGGVAIAAVSGGSPDSSSSSPPPPTGGGGGVPPGGGTPPATGP